MTDMTLLGRFSGDGSSRMANAAKPKRLLNAFASRGGYSAPMVLALPFPLAGAGAVVWFDNSAVETLRVELGSEYLKEIDDGLTEHNPSIIRSCLRAALRNADVGIDDIMETLPLADISTAIVDALSLKLYGKRISVKSAEDVFVQKALAVKLAMDAMCQQGAALSKNAQGDCVIDARLAPLFGYLIEALNDIQQAGAGQKS